MAEIDLLVVGPANRTTGGIARFLSEQRRRLPDGVGVRVYDSGTLPGNDIGPLYRTAVVTFLAMALFPFRRRPDVVHIHTSHSLSFYRATWYALVAGLLWRRSVVVHVHGSSFDTFAESDRPEAVVAQRLTFGVADRVIALSEGWREVLAGRVDPQKIVVVPNAVDAEAYDPTYGSDPPVVTFVSNHIERKGIREFVAALQRVELGEVRVHICGAGPLAGLAAELADDSPTVEYLGFVSEERKRRVIEEASLYVLPTYAEGLPIALLEGMAGGNAVLTTDVDAIPEVVDEDSGWIVPPGDVDALADALREFAADPGAADGMGRHNRAIVEERYSWPVVIDRLTDVYRSVSDGDERSPSGRSPSASSEPTAGP